jgi:transposase
MDLTDEQWMVIDPLLIRPARRADGKGRPRVPDRPVLDGILWILRTGAPWSDLPERYPPYQTCHRRLQEWVANGTFEAILIAVARDLQARGQIDLSECFIDGTFVPAKKGGRLWALPSEEKAASSWPLQTALVFLSPVTWTLLNRMKSPLLSIHWPGGLRMDGLNIWWATAPTTATRLTQRLRRTGSR